MATGRVLQFDQARGYGFVAAGDGGEDIFLHASVFDGDPEELVPGAKVEFKVMEGDRGRKAFAAHLIADEPNAGGGQAPLPQPIVPSQPIPSSGPVNMPVAAQPPAPVPHVPSDENAADEEQMCDVLSPTEFGQELTELLLSNVPTLTGQEILGVRQSMLDCARKHGWVDI